MLSLSKPSCTPYGYNGQWNFVCDLFDWRRGKEGRARSGYLNYHFVPEVYRALPILTKKEFKEDEGKKEKLFEMIQTDPTISEWLDSSTLQGIRDHMKHRALSGDVKKLFFWVLYEAILMKISQHPLPPIPPKLPDTSEKEEEESTIKAVVNVSSVVPEVSEIAHQRPIEDYRPELTRDEASMSSTTTMDNLEISHQKSGEYSQTTSLSDEDTTLPLVLDSGPKDWRNKVILVKMLDGRKVPFMVRAQISLQHKTPIQLMDITHQMFMKCIERTRGIEWPQAWRMVYKDGIYGNQYDLAEESGFYEGRAMFEASEEFDKNTTMSVSVEQTGEPPTTDASSA